MLSLILHLSLILCVYCDLSEYKSKRDKLIQDEYRLTLGGNINLTEKETIVNNCIMKYKFLEVDYGFTNPKYFNFSHHYFSYKEKIRYSKVYQIIKDMPKGAALHVHDMGILGPDYLMNITYMDNLYVCFDRNVNLKFSNKPPNIPCDGEWQLVSKIRDTCGNITKFDAKLRKHFSLVVENPDIVYPSITESWNTFMNYFVTVAPMLTYRPIWEQYFYDVLYKFRENNIMYVEVRSILPKLYELDGTEYDPLITAKAYRKAITRFTKDYPDFVGAKLIYAPSRQVDNVTVEEYLKLAKILKKDVPEIFAGFDLVGQEDLGSPLIEFLPQLVAARDEINYFFHAGETDWYGTSTDDNLFDAILLGAKRLGHAYALPKHPLLMKEVINNDIGLEVNVISNTVLSLVRDVRNHPLNIFLAHGLPVVLSSDDPGAWEADPISEDYYVAFVGVASRVSDLRMLKALAMNSLKYSALDGNNKANAIKKFTVSWNDFVEKFNCASY
ncbi:adenosine deaminase 2-A-like [Galleria mellonella]|uniref:Adenosine deaminase n=1 Tax=Galleria mellonella TaxID=7137 RepID=A0A6J1X508_GALME|nr:adenosine deaminase 2-A-like [Galleria mellonella]